MKLTGPTALSRRAGRSGGRGVGRIVALLLAVLSCAAGAVSAPKIRLGVETNSPPLSFVDARGLPTGFTNELLREIGRDAGIEFEIVADYWKFISTEFQAGRLDALANVTITAERRATMGFSIAHASVHAIANSRRGAPGITTTAQFPGKTMGTLTGTAGHLRAVEYEGWGARIVRFDSWRAKPEAVRDGACDFALLMRRLQPGQPDEPGLHRESVDDIVFPFHFAMHSGDRRTLERLDDLRPYAWPGALALGLLAALCAWQQKIRRRLLRQAAALRESEENVRESLREKEALLKEVHHRVKNNLQVIMSLLRMEARRSGQADTKSVLGEMQGRIRSMALLHESLYRSGTFAAVDLGAYLNQLAAQSFRTHATSAGRIQLQLDLASVEVEMDRALPCGLLVNELLSNALKHGFPAGRTGAVRVRLQPVAGGPQWRLGVTDTGVGLPADFESRRTESLGLQLVRDLTAQLRGALETGSGSGGSGAAFTVTFAPGVSPPAPAPD